MGFMTSLFGGSASTVMGAVFALGIVCVLIVIAVWVVKFVFQTPGTIARAKNRRLQLVESMPLDGKRQMLLIRRDGVEHLILTGGPQDVVVETGIAVDKAAVHHPVHVAPPVAALAASIPPHTAPVHVAVPAVLAPQTDMPEPVPAPFLADGTNLAAASRAAVERLREFTRPIGRQASRSLRHTGLMRAGRVEVIPGYLDGAKRDSAKTTQVAEAKGGDGTLSREGLKADGA